MLGITYIEVVQSTLWRLAEFVLSALCFDATVMYMTVEQLMGGEVSYLKESSKA